MKVVMKYAHVVLAASASASWEELPTVEWREAAADIEQHFATASPIVLRSIQLVPPGPWQDLSSLLKILPNTPVTVKISPRLRVPYFKEARNTGKHEFDSSRFLKEITLPLHEIVSHVSAATLLSKHGFEENMSFYVQENLAGHPELGEMFSSWRWSLILGVARRHGWGLPETNVLWMGTSGSVTPTHFDEQHNLLAQVRGRKICALLSPDHYTALYPFPTTHPADRCAMADVTSPDLKLFPNVGNINAKRAELNAGDALFIPYGWWHYCQNLDHLTTSITFWARAEEKSGETISPSAWPRVRRNLEKMISDKVGAEQLNSTIAHVLETLESRQTEDNPLVKQLLHLVGLVGVPSWQQRDFIRETFKGRFGSGIDYNLFL